MIKLVQSNSVGRKQGLLHSLREENTRIRNDLKQISKALSTHINRQLRDKSNTGIDVDKEIKFLDGNILNARKRLEIIEYEHYTVLKAAQANSSISKSKLYFEYTVEYRSA